MLNSRFADIKLKNHSMRAKLYILFIVLLLWQVFASEAKAQEIKLAIDSFSFVSSLSEAVLKPDTVAFDSLLLTGMKVDYTTTEGVTALMFASEQGNLLFMKKLINAGANVNSLPKNGVSALHSAINAGNTNAVKLLLHNGARLDMGGELGITPLLSAVQNNNTAMVKLLLAYGADIYAANTKGKSALHYAVEFGNDSLVILLVESGLSVNASTQLGITPLMVAVQNDFTETAELLLSYGADINRVTNANFSALSFAIMNGNAYLAELLLVNGADTVHRQKKARDHWYIAQGTGGEMRKVLREYGVKRNVKPVFDDFVEGAQFRMADAHLETAILFGIRETKYNFLLQTSFGVTPFVFSSLHKIDKISYQFWERNYWFALELNKFIALTKQYRTEFGLFGGLETEYRFGSYRATKIKPDSGISFMPVGGLYFRRDYVELKAGYTFERGEQNPAKIGLQLHFYISRAINETTF